MLTKSDYLKLLLKKAGTIFFYHDRPVLYTIEHKKKKYLIALADEHKENQSETFILVNYTDATYTLMQDTHMTPREYFTRPDNLVHLAVIEYKESGPVITYGEQYADNTTIPDAYLPTEDARWK